jgi:Fe-S cluster assembly protein SufB
MTNRHQPASISGRTLDEDLVRGLSRRKREPEWMLDHRLRALASFARQPAPSWGADLTMLPLEDLAYYVTPQTAAQTSWDDVPSEIKTTFDKLGIPAAERKYLAGVGAQYNSETVYHALQAALRKKGVIFCDMETGVREHPELVKKYFGTLIPAHDNKFTALNAATWSGGSFIFVPAGVKVELPMQAYFRINAPAMGQFERTLIIAETGSEVQYIEGCSAPTYSRASLHAGVVEIFVGPGARVQYITMQNWSRDVYNLVTKRARVEANGRMGWIDGNFGSGVTMKYPACYLVGPQAHGEVLSISLAGQGQEMDCGARMLHLAPETSSLITAKSIVRHRGRSTFRGLVRMMPAAHQAVARMKCETLLLDQAARTETYPVLDIRVDDARATHEAAVSKVDAAQLFYLMTRGISEAAAVRLMVGGFIEPIVRKFPMEYAVELTKLINLEMEGSVG